MNFEDYKFIDETEKAEKNFISKTQDIEKVKSNLKSHFISLIQKIRDSSNLSPSKRQNKIENNLYKASNCAALFKRSTEFVDVVMDLNCCKLICELINEFSASIEPYSLSFLANILSLPGTRVSDAIVENKIVEYIISRATEAQPSRESIIALNNVFPSIIGTEYVDEVASRLNYEYLFSEENDDDIAYPALFLAKTYYELLHLELTEENFDQMLHLIDTIFSSNDDYLHSFDKDSSGFYPLINTLINDFNELAIKLPNCFFDHLMCLALDFAHPRESCLSISIIENIINKLKILTPSSEPIVTPLFDSFEEIYERDGFKTIIECMKAMPSEQKIYIYKFVKAYGVVYPKIYSDEQIILLVQASQIEFINGPVELKEVIAKFMTRFISMKSCESIEYIDRTFIESVVDSICATQSLAKKSIKLITTFYITCKTMEDYEEKKEFLADCELIDQLESVQSNFENEQITAIANNLITYFLEDEVDDGD